MEPLLGGGRQVPAATQTGSANRFLSFLERHLGSDTQLAAFLMCLGQAVDLWNEISFYIAPPQKPSAPNPDEDVMTSRIDAATNIGSSTVFLIGNMLFLYALHPMRILLNAGYDGGTTTEAPANFWKRHFGTPALIASQTQGLAIALIILDGAMQVYLIDSDVYSEKGGLRGMWDICLTANDGHAWALIFAAFLGLYAFSKFNNAMYPDRLFVSMSPNRARSGSADFLDRLVIENWISRSWATWIRGNFLSDNLFQSWVLVVAMACWTAVELNSGVGDLSVPVLYFVGSLLLLRWAYNEGTMFDACLFGCHKTNPLPVSHPMGNMFNASSRDVDINAGIDAALDVLKNPGWSRHSDGVCLLEYEDVAGISLEMDIDMHAFALTQVFASEEFRKQMEPAIEHVEVIESLGTNARLVYVSSGASPPMPRSDEVYISATRESPDQIVVAQWAVEVPEHGPKQRVVRNYPFSVSVLTPIDSRKTHITICSVTSVASFMPRVLMREELLKSISDADKMKAMPHSHDGQELLDIIQREVWKTISQEMTPCLWDLFRSCAPEIAQLNVTREQSAATASEGLFRRRSSVPQDPLSDLSTLGVEEPMQVASAALAFSCCGSWRETRKRMCWSAWSRRRPEQTQIWRHDRIPNALRASTTIIGAHPMVIAMALTQPDFKRQGDNSISVLREIRKVSDFCSVYYQRSHFKPPLRDRDAVYACLLVDWTPHRALVVEWPVQDEEYPEAQHIQRSRSLFLYDVQKKETNLRGPTETELTITAVVDMGGSLGSRFLRPVVRGRAAQSMLEGIGEMHGFFCTTEGIELRTQFEAELIKETCQTARREMTALQVDFMDTYSEVFSSSRPEPGELLDQLV